MKYKILLFLFALLILSSVPASETHSESSPDYPDAASFKTAYTVRDPISISGDNGFENLGFPGNGTAENPYRIEGYNITKDDVCIYISGTSAHYIIGNCFISSPSSSTWEGIFLSSAPNGTVEDCIIKKHDNGIYVGDSDDCVIHNNTAQENGIALQLHDCTSCVISNNTAVNNEEGLNAKVDFSVIKHNILNDSEIGARLRGNSNEAFYNEANNNSDYGFYVDGDNHRITNNILARNRIGMYFVAVSGLNVSFNEIYENTQYGLFSSHIQMTDSVLANNTISYNRHGFYMTKDNLMGSQTCSFPNNTLYNNGLYLDFLSLQTWLTNVEGTTVNDKPLGYFRDLNNTVINGNNYGQLIIANCSFTEVIGGSYDNVTAGVIVMFSDNCTIRDVTSSNNSAEGFMLRFSQDLHIKNSTASNNLKHGFNVDEVDYCYLEQDKALANSKSGFYFQNSEYPELLNNSAVSNLQHGFDLNRLSVEYKADWILMENNATDNTEHGFQLFYLENCNLTGNIAEHNYGSGFYTQSCAAPDFLDNEAIENGYDGFYFNATDIGELHSNLASGNSIHGFDFIDLGAYTLANNSAVENAKHGFRFENALNCSLQNNTAESNIRHGFALLSSENLTLSNNNATFNDASGIGLSHAINCTFHNNSIIHNNFGVEVDENSDNHLFYLNNIGYNIYYNAIDDNPSTIWDNGDSGNCWGDYNGSGAYQVYGLAGNVDNYPCLLDLYAPILNHPQDFSYELGTLGNSITWTASDLRLDSYIVYRNNSAIDSGAAKSANLTVDVDGLNLGVYNYTVVVNDTLGKISIDTVIVTVLDSTPPELDHPDDIDCELGSTGNVITWNPTDLEPDSYKLYQEGSLVEERSWSGTAIEHSLDGLGVGTYVFTLVAYDTTGNNASDSVTVSVTDMTSPVVSSPDDLEYELGSTGNMISWDVSEFAPQIYRIIRNGTVLEEAAWEGEQISYNIDGLSLNTYNFTITVTDASGNNASDSVFVSVVDSTVPSLDSPADSEYELGSTGNVLTWNASDLNPQSYRIYRNGSSIHDASWEGSDIQCNLDGLSLGDHNFTVVITDGTGNNASDSVIVSVVDTTAPSLDSSSNTQYELGSTGNSIIWTASDLDPFAYEVFIDGSLVQNASWNGAQIEYNVDGFMVGSYNVMLIIYDSSGNYANDMVTVYVDDTVAPTIDSPSDVEHELNSTGNSIGWDVSDLDPQSYEVYRNRILIQSEYWNGSSIECKIDGLSVGSYNFTLTVYDGTGNKASDTVTVDVVDTVVPIISSPEDITYQEETSGHNVSWNVSDAGMVTYFVLRNGTALYDGKWNGSDIVVDVDSLAPGIYNFTVVVTDEGGNQASDSVLVSVLPTTDTTTTTTSTTTSETTSTTTTGTTPPEGQNPMMIGLAAGVAIAGIALIVVLFVIPRLKLEGRL